MVYKEQHKYWQYQPANHRTIIHQVLLTLSLIFFSVNLVAQETLPASEKDVSKPDTLKETQTGLDEQDSSGAEPEAQEGKEEQKEGQSEEEEKKNNRSPAVKLETEEGIPLLEEKAPESEDENLPAPDYNSTFYQDFQRQQQEAIKRSQQAADQSQIEVSRRLHRFSAYVDKFFVEESYIEESTDSRLRVALVNEYQKHYDPSLRPRMSLSLALPNTKNKWRLQFQSDDELEQGQEEDTSISATGTAETDSSFITALGRTIRSDRKVDLRLQAGLKFHTPVDPFVRFRARRTFNFDKLELRLTKTPQWRDSEGKSASTLFEAAFPISSNYLFRSRSEVVYWDINSYWSGSQSFVLYDQLTAKSVIAYAIGASGQDEDDLHLRKKYQVNEYWVETRYRKNFYQHWLFYQISPGLVRPREFDFETLPRLELKLEAVYGDIGSGSGVKRKAAQTQASEAPANP